MVAVVEEEVMVAVVEEEVMVAVVGEEVMVAVVEVDHPLILTVHSILDMELDLHFALLTLRFSHN